VRSWLLIVVIVAASLLLLLAWGFAPVPLWRMLVEPVYTLRSGQQLLHATLLEVSESGRPLDTMRDQLTRPSGKVELLRMMPAPESSTEPSRPAR
jgi:hypothetical protein